MPPGDDVPRSSGVQDTDKATAREVAVRREPKGAVPRSSRQAGMGSEW